VKVGIHQHVQVTTGMNKEGLLEICKDPNQIINQVFTAAVNMGDIPSSTSGLEIHVAKYLLWAAYRGTILSAIENSLCEWNQECIGKNKLYLTLIGGGVFRNSLTWIIKAIQDNEELMKRAGLQIYLIIFENNLRSAEFSALSKITQRLQGKVINVE